MNISPQAENGHTDIANELMDALAKIRISGEAMQVLLFIIRKTYGWHKKEDRISLSKFMEGTGLKKNTICRALVKLKTMNLIVTKKENDFITSYCFNKHYNLWKPLPKKRMVSKKENGGIQKREFALPKKRHTKETNTKETNTKEKYMAEFLQFWSIYPKKVKRTPCEKKWQTIVKSESDANKLIIALQNQIRLKYISSDIKYVPDPLTWLNQERWNDEIVEDRKCNKCGNMTTFYIDDSNKCDCGGKYEPYQIKRKFK